MMQGERDKLEKLKKEINRLLDENEAFLHWDNVREEIVLESNYTSVATPIDSP